MAEKAAVRGLWSVKNPDICFRRRMNAPSRPEARNQNSAEPANRDTTHMRPQSDHYRASAEKAL